MALKAVIDTAEELEAVPEALRESYVEADGHWYLSIEGQTRREAELGSKVSEFRETNVGLMKEKSTIADQLETVTQRYSGVDPALYQEMMGERQKLDKRNARVVTNDDLSAQIQSAVRAAVDPIQEQLDESRRREIEAQAELDGARFKSLVGKAALDSGVRPEAVDDVLGRAVAAGFALHDGQASIVEDGITRFSPSKPDQPYHLEEWIQGLQRGGGSHLFQPSISTGDQEMAGPEARMESGELQDPSGRQFARNLEAIASGKVRVTRTANS